MSISDFKKNDQISYELKKILWFVYFTHNLDLRCTGMSLLREINTPIFVVVEKIKYKQKETN